MKWLTKSDYLKYLIHPAYLWLQKHDKDRLPPFDESVQAIVDAGNEIEEYARGLFAEGVLVKSLFQDSVRETEGYVKAERPVIFQAAVLTDRRLYAKADVITRNADGSWDVHEIKSATKIKPEYISDLAFQKNAFEISGYEIKRCWLVHINNKYVRRGAVEPRGLFTAEDVTAQVDAAMGRTRRGIEEALDIIALPEMPDDGPGDARNWYAWRDIYRHLHPELPASSVLNLTRLKPEQVRAFARAGVTELSDIPPSVELGEQQIAQLEALKAGAPIIKTSHIAKHMAKLRFPLYFFDYETTGGGIPPYDGTRPYQQIPFQYSLDILGKEDGKLEHAEFLATDKQNPMPALLENMRRDIGEEGSVVVWFKGFEGGVNETMAGIYPEYATFLKGVNRRLYDLMEIFSNFFYVDAAFGGSASIKNVLPVLVPELSYKELAIQKGDVAALKWKAAAFGQLDSAAAAEQVFEDLRVYCGQDTLAMVRIYEFLMKVKEEAPGAQLSLLG